LLERFKIERILERKESLRLKEPDYVSQETIDHVGSMLPDEKRKLAARVLLNDEITTERAESSIHRAGLMKI
jgi:hypothetical protein